MRALCSFAQQSILCYILLHITISCSSETHALSDECTIVDTNIIVCHLANYSTVSTKPAIDGIGGQFYVSWTEQDSSSLSASVHYRRINANDTVQIEDDVVITNAYFNSQSALQWNGSSIGFLWGDTACAIGNCTRFMLTDETGSVQHSWNGDDYLPPSNPNLVWNGMAYGASLISFGGYIPGINVALIDSSGALIDAPTSLASDILVAGPRVGLEWSGSEYAVVWHQIPDYIITELQFARLDRLGNVIGAPSQLTNMDWSYSPDIQWTGSEYGIAWISRRHVDTQTTAFMRVGGDGTPLSIKYYDSGVNSWQPVLLWTGSKHVVFWIDGLLGAQRLVYNSINPDGSWGADERILRGTKNAIIFPRAIALHDKIGIVWAENVQEGAVCFEEYMEPDADYPRCDMDLFLGVINYL